MYIELNHFSIKIEPFPTKKSVMILSITFMFFQINLILQKIICKARNIKSELMKERIYLPSSQTLLQALPFILPNSHPLLYSFKQLSRIMPKDVQLDEELQQFCQHTFVLLDKEPPISYTSCVEAHRFLDIINENVRQLLSLGKVNYVQCFGQQYKDYNLSTKSLNFGKTILESSLLEKISLLLGEQWTKKLIYNYTIIIKYKGDYFQVTGIQLPEQFQFKPFGDKKKKVTVSKPQMGNFFTETINRFQMLYCSHINRNSGLFRKNVFFDQGVRKSSFVHEVEVQTQKLIKSMFPEKFLKQQEAGQFGILMFGFFNKVRNLFELKRQNNRNMSQFDSMLARFCRLPNDYKDIKVSVEQYLEKGQGSSQALFERMYASESNYNSVYQLLKNVISRVFPTKFIGQHNYQILISMLKQFIAMKRYENYKIEDFLTKMDIFQIPWLRIKYNKKFKWAIISRGRKILGTIIVMLFNKLLIPILKLNFYITEKHKQANKLFYYRKPIWVLISRLAIRKFSEINLEPINQAQYFDIKKAGTDYPEGKLRLMPKKGTFRPIVTFNRKRKVEGDFYKATLNQILADTQLVLRNLKNILGRQLGYCIFDNKQISRKYDEFVLKWRSKGQPKLVYFTLDIRKCYDSIDTNTLVKIIEKTPFIEDFYVLIKYYRMYRNKKPLSEQKPFSYYFNMKQRIHATSLKNDPIKIYQDNTPAINVFLARQKIISREEIIKKLKQLCDGSIIRYKKKMWLQKLGIPQGLNVSGVLCSLYFAYLESQEVKVNEGLLMRLTDDYIYIGPEEEARDVLTSLLKCASKNNFVFNSDKISKNFVYEGIENIKNEEYIHWIGKKININTLQIFPAYDQGSDRLAFAMNVNINRKQIKGFLKNKLKSLLTNHFAAYFKPHIYSLSTSLQNIKLYCRISLSKFFPFLISLHKLKIENQSELVMKILQLTIHQFLIYACSFHEQRDRHYHYHKYLKIVLEEFISFMKEKRSFQFLKNVERIFTSRMRRLTKQLRIYEQTLMID